MNYYNEFDPYAAEWLRNLIKAGHIPNGEVDVRSIVDVQPDDLRGFTQCHFFAGIAGWSHALRLAGWDDEREIWTGSCPCQPFSVAGKGAGTDDPRHLWPHFFRLIAACRPQVVMGEQVAGAAGYGWLDGVRTDLEGEGYACEGIDIPACAVNAPHIRQRLYWVAQDVGLADGAGRDARQLAAEAARHGHPAVAGGGSRVVADAERDGAGHFAGEVADEGRRTVDARAEGIRRGDGSRLSGGADARDQSGMADADISIGGQRGVGLCGQATSGKPGVIGENDMANAESIGRGGRSHDEDEGRRQQPFADPCEGSGDVADADDAGRKGRQLLPERAGECSAWSDGVEWRRGADGKTRRVKSGVLLLAHGVPARVGRLRAYGNAIVPPLAAEVIKAFMETTNG